MGAVCVCLCGCVTNLSHLYKTISFFPQIIMGLPEFRRNVFLYLCFFLQELLSHANENGLDAKTLGRSLN